MNLAEVLTGDFAQEANPSKDELHMNPQIDSKQIDLNGLFHTRN